MLTLTGGSVYPHQELYGADGNLRPASSGITLRDKFADTALARLIGTHDSVHFGPAEYAESAYKIADAMIKERAK